MYAQDGATEVEVMEAAVEANAHKFISALPDGYRIVAGEGGAAIWGEEAEGGDSVRAAAGRGDMSARRGVRALRAGGAGTGASARTTVMVAHRLSTVPGADTIEVVEEGRVVEKGSHSQLLAQNSEGSYARMIQLQLFPL